MKGICIVLLILARCQDPTPVQVEDYGNPYKPSEPTNKIQVPACKFKIVEKYSESDDLDCRYEKVCETMSIQDVKIDGEWAIFYTAIRSEPPGTNLTIERLTAETLSKFMHEVAKKEGEGGFMVMTKTNRGPCLLGKRNGNVLQAILVELRDDGTYGIAKDVNGEPKLTIVYPHAVVNSHTEIVVCEMPKLGLGDTEMGMLKDLNIEILKGVTQPEEEEDIGFLGITSGDIINIINSPESEAASSNKPETASGVSD